jgi:hypothetical protein
MNLMFGLISYARSSLSYQFSERPSIITCIGRIKIGSICYRLAMQRQIQLYLQLTIVIAILAHLTFPLLILKVGFILQTIITENLKITTRMVSWQFFVNATYMTTCNTVVPPTMKRKVFTATRTILNVHIPWLFKTKLKKH